MVRITAKTTASDAANAPTTFKDAAAQVLRDVSPAPLTAKQIYQRITSLGLSNTTGKTPWNSVASQLYTDIKSKGELSRFVQPGPGLFALRDGYIEGAAMDDDEMMHDEDVSKKKTAKKTAKKRDDPDAEFVWHEYDPSGKGAKKAVEKGAAAKNTADKTTAAAAAPNAPGTASVDASPSKAASATANASPSPSKPALEKRKDHDVFRFEHKPILTPILFDVDLNGNELPNRFVSQKQKKGATTTTDAAQPSKKRKRMLYETESDDEEDVHFAYRRRQRQQQRHVMGVNVVKQNGALATVSCPQKPSWDEVLSVKGSQFRNASTDESALNALLNARHTHLTNVYQHIRQQTLQIQNELQEMYDAFIEHRDQWCERRYGAAVAQAKQSIHQTKPATESTSTTTTSAAPFNAEDDNTTTIAASPNSSSVPSPPPPKSTLASIPRQHFGSLFAERSDIRLPYETLLDRPANTEDNVEVPEYVPSELIVHAPVIHHYPIEKVYKTAPDGKTLLCSRGNCMGRRMMCSEFCVKCVLYDEKQVLYVKGKFGVHDPVLKGTPDVLPLPEERRW